MKYLLLMFLLPELGTAASVDEVKAFLTKKGACHVAVAQIVQGKVVGNIICIWDGVFAAGTIREAAGCMIGRYNANTDAYGPLNPYSASLTGGNKGACSRDLMRKMLFEDESSRYLAGSGHRPLWWAVIHNKDLAGKMVTVMDAEKVLEPIPTEPKFKRVAPKINCADETFGEEKLVQCSSPNELVSQVCNTNLDDGQITARKRVYRKKTGKEMPECRK